jgi:FkbM family methyltransferase
MPVVLDVGGNIGAAALLFHLRYQARVVSIEAIAQTYTQLHKNCSSYDDITVVQAAVGDRVRTTSLYRYPLAPGLGGLNSSRIHIWYVLSMQMIHTQSWKSIGDFITLPFRLIAAVLWSLFALLIVWTRSKQQVKQNTLAHIIDSHLSETTIDLVKIDIEGHELKALLGLEEKQWNQITAFIMEVHPDNINAILDLLTQHQFVVVSREPALLHGTDIPEIIIAKKTKVKDYHQQYLQKNPGGYCGLRGTGVECRI